MPDRHNIGVQPSVRAFGGVADGMDVGIDGAQELVDPYTAVDGEAYASCQLGPRLEAASNDEAMKALRHLVLQFHSVKIADFFETLDGGVQANLYAMVLQHRQQRSRVLFDQLSLHEPWQGVKQHDAVAGLGQIGGDLAADQPAADHCPQGRRRSLDDFFTMAPELEQVVEAVYDEEQVAVSLKRRWDQRIRARREHEFVVIQGELARIVSAEDRFGALV